VLPFTVTEKPVKYSLTVKRYNKKTNDIDRNSIAVREHEMKHIIIIITLVILSVAGSTYSHADKAFSANEKGIRAFNDKKYDESAEQFTEAAVDRPDSPELKFNLGTALSEKNETEDALKQLNSAADGFSEPKRKAAAYYNAGNTRFLAGDLEGAISEYVRAVKLDQESEDIRFNLERAICKLKEQEKQQQNKDNDSDQKKEEEQQEEEEKKSKTDNTDQEQQEDQQQQQSDQQESEDRQMTPEEAQRILDALSDEEKKTLSLRRMQMEQEIDQGDDW